MAGPIRVVIADDHPIMRFAMRTLLSKEPDMEIVGEAADGVGALTLARALLPDVMALDLKMPGIPGVQVIEDLAATAPYVRVLVLSGFADDEHVLGAIRAGAHGYLLKESGPDVLIEGIRAVASGGAPLHPAVARRLLREYTNPPPAPATDELTQREKEVLALVAQGLSNEEIAARISLSEGTVRSHVSTILGKLDLSSRIEAALYALRAGLVRVDGQPL